MFFIILSAVPTGLCFFPRIAPDAEALGYSQTSLRDFVTFTRRQFKQARQVEHDRDRAVAQLGRAADAGPARRVATEAAHEYLALRTQAVHDDGEMPGLILPPFNTATARARDEEREARPVARAVFARAPSQQLAEADERQVAPAPAQAPSRAVARDVRFFGVARLDDARGVNAVVVARRAHDERGQQRERRRQAQLEGGSAPALRPHTDFAARLLDRPLNHFEADAAARDERRARRRREAGAEDEAQRLLVGQARARRDESARGGGPRDQLRVHAAPVVRDEQHDAAPLG